MENSKKGTGVIKNGEFALKRMKRHYGFFEVASR